MRVSKVITGVLALTAAGAALAGPTVVPLGQPLGDSLGIGLGDSLGGTLGSTLGTFLGTPLGAIVPLAGSGVLLVGAASLAVGIYMSRRKRGR
jgi:hypothetical protein